MSAHVPLLPLELDPLIAEAKQRARRRRLIAATALLAVGLAVAGVLAFGAGRSSGGEVPWLSTRPQLGPANPPLAPACRASQLRAKLFLQGGGFGSLIGPLTVTNIGSAPCALVGVPSLSLSGATSKWILRRGPQQNEYDPLTPVQASLRAFAPGRSAATYLTWSGWCGRGSSRKGGNPGQPPKAMVLSPSGGGRISVASDLRDHQLPAPGFCPPGGGSSLAASRFVPIVPQGGPSSALPLDARIVPVGAAHRGTWLSYTVVLTNRGAKPFSFGRSCPAYEEGFGLRPAAYVLNCHGVGPIAPHAAVRFAMKVFIPRHGAESTLAWTLGPHTWNGGVLAAQKLRLR